MLNGPTLPCSGPPTIVTASLRSEKDPNAPITLLPQSQESANVPAEDLAQRELTPAQAPQKPRPGKPLVSPCTHQVTTGIFLPHVCTDGSDTLIAKYASESPGPSSPPQLLFLTPSELPNGPQRGWASGPSSAGGEYSLTPPPEPHQLSLSPLQSRGGCAAQMGPSLQHVPCR